MDEMAISTFAAQVVANAQRTFGGTADAGLLDRYAREAALDLWCTTPGLTVSAVELALRRVRVALTGQDHRAAELPAAA